MTIARRAAISRTDIRTAIRAEVRDPATNRSGVARAPASLRWSNDGIDRAFNFALEELQQETRVGNPGERLVAVDTTYSAASSDVALPSGITSADLIYKVERIVDTSHPQPIEYVSPLEIERFSFRSGVDTSNMASYFYTLVARDAEMRLAIRPTPPAGMPIRISVIAPATVTGADADTHALSSHWYEFIVLSTAEKLLRPDDEFSAQQREALERHRDYVQGSSTRAGPQRIRSRRRYV